MKYENKISRCFLFVYVFVCVCSWECTCVHVFGSHAQPQAYSSGATHLRFVFVWERDSHCPGATKGRLGWLQDAPEIRRSPPPGHWDCKHHHASTFFFKCAESGDQTQVLVCTAHALPSELSVSPAQDLHVLKRTSKKKTKSLRWQITSLKGSI